MPELPKEPGLRRLPVAHHGLGRHVQHIGRLFDAEPAEVPQFHDLTHPRVERRQSAQGIAQGDHIALFRLRQVSDVLDPLTDYAAATLLPAAIAGGLDEDPSHRLRRQCQKVRPAAPFNAVDNTIQGLEAVNYAEMGDLDKAFESLQRALDVRDPGLVHLAVAPQWDSLRADPRFNECLARMKLRPVRQSA